MKNLTRRLLKLAIGLVLVFLFLVSFKTAKAEIFTEKFVSLSSDGIVRYYDGLTWEDTRNAEIGTWGRPDYYYGWVSSEKSLIGYRITRTFLPFDTTSIPPEADVLSATLYFYLEDSSDEDSDGNDFVTVVKTFQNDTSTLHESDYQNIGSVEGAEKNERINLAFATSSMYHSIQLNNTGLSWIKKEDITTLGLREGHDLLDIPINVNGYTGLSIYFSENIINTPYLEIVYEISNDPFPTLKQPVIIIPGILGSHLRSELFGQKYWLDLLGIAVNNDDEFLHWLDLDENGESVYEYIPEDILRDPPVNQFKSMLGALIGDGYSEGADLFVFPYDWRLKNEINAGAEPGAKLSLNELVDQVIASSGHDQVDIIAHSMGGLVVKSYLKEFGGDKVDKFIDIATPHLGAPKAFKVLHFGDNMDIPLLEPITMKAIAQNMPSVYQLLPSKAYFNIGNGYYNYYYRKIYDDGYGYKGEYDYNDSMSYLIFNDSNINAITWNDGLHSQIDNLSVDNFYNIVGCGMPTIGRITDTSKLNKKSYRLRYIDGDGTVPLESAAHLPVTAYVKKTKHAQLTDNADVPELALAKLSYNAFDFSSHNKLSPNRDICGFSGMQVSVHSPVELHAYDNAGNHNGRTGIGNEYETVIPASAYDELDEDKFIFLPNGGDYLVTATATKSGSFDLIIQRVMNGEYLDLYLWQGIELPATGTEFWFNISDSLADINLNMDYDNDGIADNVIPPSSILEDGADDYLAPSTDAALIGLELGADYYYQNVMVELAASDEDSGVLANYYRLNEGAWQIYESAFAITKPGEQKLEYYSVDKAGNYEQIKQKNFKIEAGYQSLFQKLRDDIKISYQNDELRKSMRNYLIAMVNHQEKHYGFYFDENRKPWIRKVLKIKLLTTWEIIERQINRQNKKSRISDSASELLKININHLKTIL